MFRHDALAAELTQIEGRRLVRRQQDADARTVGGQALPHDGRDVRAFVVGGRVLAAIERVGAGWRANLARGARARATTLTAEQERVCLEAAAALGVDYAGVWAREPLRFWLRDHASVS